MDFEVLTDKSPEALVALAAELLTEHLGVDGVQRSVASIERTISATLPRGSNASVTLATDGAKPVGVCFANSCIGVESRGDYLWINEMYVRPEYRSQGAGRELFDFVAKTASEAGCLRIVAWTTVGNKRSQKFFAENGFNLSDVIALDKSLVDSPAD